MDRGFPSWPAPARPSHWHLLAWSLLLLLCSERVSTRGSWRTEEGACPHSGPEWLCQKLLLEGLCSFCSIFLFVSQSPHWGWGRTAQWAESGPEWQLRTPGGAWLMEADGLAFTFRFSS